MASQRTSRVIIVLGEGPLFVTEGTAILAKFGSDARPPRAMEGVLRRRGTEVVRQRTNDRFAVVQRDAPDEQ